MARRLATLSGRLVLIVLLIHAVLLPVLYLALETVVAKDVTGAFIDDARIQGRLIADNLELLDDAESEAALITHLDSAVLGARVVYAALEQGDGRVVSSLMTDADVTNFAEDFEFGEHQDDTYYLSLPIVAGGGMAILRLGFDESQTRGHLETVRRSIIYVLVAYLVVTLLATTYLSSAVIKPLRRLQRTSRKIASGRYDKKLKTDSGLAEIHELTLDLDQMRSNLVGVNARLKQEISERETAEAERTRLETRLQHAQRLESLGTLAGGVAHEFNNVLQPLLLYTDLALEDLPKDWPAASNMQRVLRLAQRAKGLSHQILTFGRQAEETPLKVQAISPIVEEAATMIRALLPATIEIRTDINSDAGSVRCDAAQIQQLVVNLCNNAFRALTTSDGHISISLRRAAVTADLAERHANLREGQYVVLKIADTGHGMDAETRERIFEPFFTTHDVGKGTGLGLSVVHGTVVRHEGEIILKSQPGKGTSFQIYLPQVSVDGLRGDD